MKITNVRACQPVADNSPPDWRTSIGQILVAVDTDAGVTGYGVGGGGVAGVHIVRTVLHDLLVGRHADDIDASWQAMYDATLAFGRKGIAIMAISGVDLALWDVRGKARRQSVCALLGGTTGVLLPTYVTVWGDIPAELAGQHQGYKLHVERFEAGERLRRVVDRVKRARDTVGYDCELMLDAWMKWDIASTLEIAERLVEYKIGWIEEPLPADDLAGYAELCGRCPIPIAGGEHEFTAAGFAEIIDRRLHHILQPDVCWCGGLTELIKIYALAAKAGLRVCPHRGAEIWALHAIAALDKQPLAESGRPWMTWVEGQPLIENGGIQPPEKPGFGVHFSPGISSCEGPLGMIFV